MLLTCLTILSAVASALICVLGGVSFWWLPLLLIGCFLGGLAVAFGFLWLMCAFVDFDKPQEHDSKFYRFLAKIYIEALVPLVRVHIHKRGLEKLPKEGPYMMVCNHQSIADPVLLLEAANGQHRVAINGGSITGWMDDEALLIGENQLTIDEEGYLAVVEDGFVWGSASFICDEPIPLYDAPEGAVIGETGFRIDLLARYPDSWLHILDVETGLDGFIREDSVVSLNAWVDALCEEYGLN